MGTLGEDTRARVDVFRGRVVGERGEPVWARIAVFDQVVQGGSRGCNLGGSVVAAAGTLADGTFVVRAPSDTREVARTIVIESQDGLRNLEPDELLGDAPPDIVLHQVRALPLSIPLLEPLDEATLIWVLVERLEASGPVWWARHTMLDIGGIVGRRRCGDHVGGLVSVVREENRVLATVLVPVGQVRIGVTLTRWPTRDPEDPGRARGGAHLFNDLELVVPPGAEPLPERSLPLPHPDASALVLRLGPWCPASVSLRHEHGVRHVVSSPGPPATQGRVCTLRLAAVPPGVYQVGDAPDCMESFEVPRGGRLRFVLRRECSVSSNLRPFLCGFGLQPPP